LGGRNKRLVEQYAIPTPFFGFSNIGRQTYRFLGLLELLRHYQENQADKKGTLRRVWVFEFRIHVKPGLVPIDNAMAISSALLTQSRTNNPLSSMERDIEAPTSEVTDANRTTIIDLERVRARLFQLAPYDFERFIKLVMERSGFINVFVTRASGDGGIDVEAHVDESDDFFAGTHIQVQAKRWRHAVGSPEINSFRGALSAKAKGVFVTTSHFTRAAQAEARHESKPSIALVDGVKLASIVIRRSVPTS
jgi:restriction endonuclease Mrr